MRLIDADELKEKLLKIQSDIVESEPRGNSKSDTWKVAYLLVFDEYIKMLDEMPSNFEMLDHDALYDVYYGKGYLKGREDILKEQQQMKDYCKNDCDAISDIYQSTKK